MIAEKLKDYGDSNQVRKCSSSNLILNLEVHWSQKIADQIFKAKFDTSSAPRA